ncbi:hypothetical protein BLX24_08215 [Arsenicibacter rosenii]|uniref:Uncharacterized protein n=2 Tax=Arsenicibacter rosenii TaxID=1750698 RepID=A0A1S2VM49_9BACT|nr:hypothetical protein BLX24_08215 [Arsenicibacter rosenii]
MPQFLEQFIEEDEVNNSEVERLNQANTAMLPASIEHLPKETIKFISQKNILADDIYTADEELTIVFYNHGKKHIVDFYPNGEIAFVIKDGNNFKTWDLNEETFYDTLINNVE